MFILLLMVLFACAISFRGWYMEMRRSTGGRRLSLLGLYRHTPKKQKKALWILACIVILTAASLLLMVLQY